MAPTSLPIVTMVHSRHKSVGPSRYVVNSNDDLQARLKSIPISGACPESF
jgi:hypothetical protein